ncbi:hypothetical protein ZOSMA_6524G00010 [Zostera marina]|uniref:Uncharacterized protein n=1 Tax=Zostera marina TaxID=29655 RepID=A0A0K9NT27_ZOSMR|nr:hypothetical protein ZOSMA_6524G00010 [Zostera marina]
MRATPRDVNFNGPNSRFCVLRPELITSFCQTEAETMSKRASNGAVDAPAESVIPTSEDIGSLETSFWYFSFIFSRFGVFIFLI